MPRRRPFREPLADVRLTVRCVAVLLTCAVTLPALAAPVAAQDEVLADVDPEDAAAEALERISDGMHDRTVEPIRESLVELSVLWPELPDKTHTKIYKAVKSLFGKFSPRDEFREDGTNDREEIRFLYEVAVGLVFDKPDGDEVLAYALKQGHIKEWPEVQAHILTGLGHRQDPQQLDLLADYLEDEAVLVAAASARSLGRLSEQDGVLRRKACDRIMRAWDDMAKRAGREARKDADGPENRHMQLLQAPFAEALTALSRQHFREYVEWRSWFDSQADEVVW